MDYVRKKRNVKIDFWEDLFKAYFDGADKQKLITNFIKNRNHVAHNKLLNQAGAQMIKENATEFRQMISDANNVFEESVPSDEVYDNRRATRGRTRGGGRKVLERKLLER
mgnify:CR=1 FL=1